MHKGTRYKTARVPVRILSRVLRLRAAPSVMRCKRWFHVCGFSCYSSYFMDSHN